MAQDFLSLKTDPSLLKALDRAVSRGMSPKERLEQRVSFVYGSIKSTNTITRDRVRDLILEQQGVRPETAQ